MSGGPCPHPLLLFCDCARLLRREFGQRIRDLGLSEPQWRVIGVVNRVPGISQRDLALILGAGKAPVAELVERLVAAGLLSRRLHPEDRRRKQVYLSAEAYGIAATLRTRFQGLSDELRGSMADSLWESLQEALLAQARAHAGPALNAALAPMALHNNLHLMAVLCRQLRHQMRPWLAEHDLSHNEWLLLATLGRRDRVTQQTLILELGLNKVPLTQALARLEQRDWLQRAIELDDRRRRLVSLTAAGRARWLQVDAATDRRLQSWLEPLRPALRRSLLQGLDHLRTQLLNPPEVDSLAS